MKSLIYFVCVLVLTACAGTTPVSPAATPSLPPPTETPTAPTPIPELKVIEGYGEGLSELTLKNIVGGMYNAQIEGLKTSYQKWTEDGSLMVEGEPQIVFMQDQNNDPKGVYTGISMGDTYIFPPLRLVPGEIPAPAYDATDNVNAPLKIKKHFSSETWIDPVTGLETNDVQLLVDSGYDEEMAKWLVDNAPDFAIRGRQFVRMKNNKVTAYLGPEGKWVKEETRFEMYPEWNEGNVQSLYYSDVTEWMYWGMRNDNTGPFVMKQMIWNPITKAVGGNCSYVTYQWMEGFMQWLDNPSTEPARRVTWAKLADSPVHNLDSARLVKLTERDGSMHWMAMLDYKVPSERSLPSISCTNPEFDGLISQETTALMEQWANSGHRIDENGVSIFVTDIPHELDEVVLISFR